MKQSRVLCDFKSTSQQWFMNDWSTMSHEWLFEGLILKEQSRISITNCFIYFYSRQTPRDINITIRKIQIYCLRRFHDVTDILAAKTNLLHFKLRRNSFSDIIQ